jgi:hypothetical protein
LFEDEMTFKLSACTNILFKAVCAHCYIATFPSGYHISQ